MVTAQPDILLAISSYNRQSEPLTCQVVEQVSARQAVQLAAKFVWRTCTFAQGPFSKHTRTFHSHRSEPWKIKAPRIPVLDGTMATCLLHGYPASAILGVVRIARACRFASYCVFLAGRAIMVERLCPVELIRCSDHLTTRRWYHERRPPGSGTVSEAKFIPTNYAVGRAPKVEKGLGFQSVHCCTCASHCKEKRKLWQ